MQKNIKMQLHNRIKNSLEKLIFIMGVFVVAFISGCGYDNYKTDTAPVEQEDTINYSILLPGTYDSKDTAVFLSKNEEEKTLTFFNLEKARNYTLNYDGTTSFYDKYDEALALSQVKEGTIVDVTFLKNSKKLNTLQVSKEAWTNSGVSRVDINEGKRNITIGSDIYKYTDDLVVIQDKKQMEIMDINAVDVLTVNGIGTSIYSVQIEKGHGYLRLLGDEYVIGGWIEVGQSLIQEITEGMLLTVPEGSYDVVISHKKYNAVERVTINRNEETTLDISDIQGEETKKGTVIFTAKPANATVFVDGEEVDISGPVELDYGIHQLMAKAEGYKTSISYLKVAEKFAGISIVLDKADEDDSEIEEDESEKNESEKDESEKDESKEDKDKVDKDKTDKDNSNTENSTDKNKTDKDTTDKNNTDKNNTDKNNTVSGGDNTGTGNTATGNDSVSDNTSNNTSGNNSSSTSTGDYYKVYIDNPAGVEVYVDGNYVGITPISFKKVSGIHVVTLRKSGYETRSYTISVDSEKKDASYSFVDLESEEEQ